MNYTAEETLKVIQNVELSFAKTDALHLSIQKLDYNLFQEEIKKKFHSRLIDKNLKFCINIDEKLTEEEFFTDVTKMNLIISNLIENSLESTYQGFVKIQIEPDVRKNCIQIIIEDTGCGIP